jgi:methylmalonyl-CoA mutase
MDENEIQQIIQDSFPISNNQQSKELWKKSATAELEGNNPFIKLVWQDQDGNKFLPYYTLEDIDSTKQSGPFDRKPSQNLFLGSRSWLNMPCITVTDEVSNNIKALTHLSNGADGILFNVKDFPSPDVDKLLQSIEWQHCAISFYSISQPELISNLEKYVAKKNIDRRKITGYFFWNDLSQIRNNSSFLECDNLKSSGCIISSSTPVKEICEALQSAVTYLNSIGDEKTRRLIFKQISFSLLTDNNFLIGISKLKALRRLWYQIARAYDIENYNPDDLHIHIRTEKSIADQFNPHGNLVKNTIAAMAAILGSCDALTVVPEDENIVMMARIARNVSNILREESHFNNVSDAVAGTYAIEMMVDVIAKEAWTMFQRTVKS